MLNMYQIKSMFLGALVGEVICSPFNYNKAKTTNLVQDSETGFYSWVHRRQTQIETKDIGRYGEYTEQLLMTLRSLLYHDNWYNQLRNNELPLWLSYGSDGNSTTKESARCLLNGAEPMELSSQYFLDNREVIVRVLPHCFVDTGVEPLIEHTFENTIQTHGNPEVIVTTLVYVLIAFTLLHTKEVHGQKLLPSIDYSVLHWLHIKKLCSRNSRISKFIQHAVEQVDGFADTWDNCLRDIVVQIQTIVGSITTGIQESTCMQLISSYNIFSVLSTSKSYLLSAIACYCLLPHSKAFEIINGFENCNNGLIATLAGSLVGSEFVYCNAQLVQDYDCIMNLLDALNDNVEFIYHHLNKAQLNLKQNLFTIGNQQQYLSGFGRLKLLNTKQVNSTKTYFIVEYTVLTELGQTLYIYNKVRRKSNELQ